MISKPFIKNKNNFYQQESFKSNLIHSELRLGARIVGIFLIILSLIFPGNIAWGSNYTDFLIKWGDDLPKLYDDAIKIEPSNSGNQIAQYTKPTFGRDHENNKKIIDGGFQINNRTFAIKDNFYTPFSEQKLTIGEKNTFEAKVFADKGLRVQEFLFGIPGVSQAHLAELGVEVWFDYDGEIKQVKAIQKSNVIDETSLIAEHEKSRCKNSDFYKNCDSVKVSMVFLEPLKDNVMALKAIDFKNRYQITYLNEGVDISGDSLNPMKTMKIPSGVRDKGLLQITQIAKYSPYWVSEDKRIFEMNRFGSFTQINYNFERFQDSGDPYTRLHSGFDEKITHEQKRATQVFDSSEVISEIPDSFTHNFPERKERITEEKRAEMKIQETIAQKILDEYNTQTRWY